VRLILKISHAGRAGLCVTISAQFALEMCVAALNNQKKLYFKNFILVFKIIQGHCFQCQSKAHVRFSISG